MEEVGEEEMEEDEVAEMSVKRPWRPSRLLLCDITWNEEIGLGRWKAAQQRLLRRLGM